MKISRFFIAICVAVLQISCAKGMPSGDGSRPNPPSEDLERESFIIVRKTHRLYIDDQEIQIGVFKETFKDRLEREVYIAKIQNNYYLSTSTNDNYQKLDEKHAPVRYQLEPFTDSDERIDTTRHSHLVQKQLYVDLFHCRYVNGYQKLLEQAAAPRPYLYFKLRSFDFSNSNPWIIRYHTTNKNIEDLLHAKGEKAGYRLGNIYILGNFRDSKQKPVLDNMTFNTSSFSYECLQEYKKRVLFPDKKTWENSDVYYLNMNIDKTVSTIIDEKSDISSSPFDHQFDFSLPDEYIQWDRSPENFFMIPKNDLSILLKIYSPKIKETL